MEREIPGKDRLHPTAYIATRPGGSSGGTVRSFAPEAYTLAGGKATTGMFRHLYYVHKEQPPIRLLVSHNDDRHGGDRDDGAEFLPEYPIVGPGQVDPVSQSARQPRFPASARLPLVDVGAGSAEEIAAVKVTGNLALLRPPADGGHPGDSGWSFIDAAAKRIADAGAAGIVVAPAADGVLAMYSKLAAVPSIPTAVLSYDEGIRLAGALARGQARVRVAGVWPSPYTYDLVFTQKQGLTNGAVHDVDDGGLARVTARYHSAKDGYYFVSRHPQIPLWGLQWGATWVWGATSELIPARTVRTEMFTPNVAFYQSRAPYSQAYADEVLDVDDGDNPLPSGTYEMNVGSGPWVPGPYGGHLVDSTGPFLRAWTGFSGPGSGILMSINRGGYDRHETSIVCEPPACEWVTPKRYKVSDGVYTVVNDQAQSKLPLSVRSHTEWMVNVHVDKDPGASTPRHQPAIQTAWYVDGSLDNSVRPGRSTPCGWSRRTGRTPRPTAS